MRPITLLVLVLLLPAATPFGSAEHEPDSVFVPPPRAGQIVRFDAVWVHANGTTSPTALAIHWSGPSEAVLDAWGVTRHAFPLVWGSCVDAPACDTRIQLVDVRTREVIRQESSSETSSSGATPYVVAHVHEQGETVSALRDFHVVPMARLGLQGMTLEVGTPIIRPLAPPPESPGAGAAVTYTPVGWETVEGARLFRVEAVTVSASGAESESTFWFDGEHSVPSREEFPVEGLGDAVRLVSKLGLYRAGEGGELWAPDDSSTRVRERSDGSSAAYSRHGPSEPFLESFPLQNAVASALLQPPVAVWMLEHPDAYLVFAQFTENPNTLQVRWTLRYASGGDRLTIDVAAPFVPGVTAPAGALAWIATRTGADPMEFPPAGLVVGDEFFCSATLEEALWEAAAGTGLDEDALAVRSGAFRVLTQPTARGVDLQCDLQIADAFEDLRVGPRAELEATERLATARLFGASGSLDRTRVDVSWEQTRIEPALP